MKDAVGREIQTSDYVVWAWRGVPVRARVLRFTSGFRVVIDDMDDQVERCVTPNSLVIVEGFMEL